MPRPVQLPLSLRILFASSLCLAVNLLAGDADASASDIAFNSGWLYQVGENADARFPETNDANWQRLTFPHEPSAHPTEVRWYRKHFNLPTAPQDERTLFRIGGVTGVISVWLNGHFLGAKTADAKGVEFDLSLRLKFDAELENVLALKLDAPTTAPRHASLRITDPTRVAKN